MTDRELEQRLRAWYRPRSADGDRPGRPARERRGHPVDDAGPTSPAESPQGFTLLAVAAILVVGGALAAGSGWRGPVGRAAAAIDGALAPGPRRRAPAETAPVTPAPIANVRSGPLIAFIRYVDKARSCRGKTAPCATPRVWLVGSDGRDAHELLADGVGSQSLLGWSPDGAHLLFTDGGKLFLTDPSGGRPQPVDTGCVPVPRRLACQDNSRSRSRATAGASSSSGTPPMRPGQRSVHRHDGPRERAGLGAELDRPGRRRRSRAGRPTGRRSCSSGRGQGQRRPGPRPRPRVFVIDADGQNLRQISAPTCRPVRRMVARRHADSLRVARNGEQQDMYTMRPDGSDVRRLTTDGSSTAATWMADGRSCSRRRGAGSAAAGWWAMDANGANGGPPGVQGGDRCGPGGPCLHLPGQQPIGGPASCPHRGRRLRRPSWGRLRPRRPRRRRLISRPGSAGPARWPPATVRPWATRPRASLTGAVLVTARMQQERGTVRPGGRHVQPDRLHVRGPLRRDRDAPPRRTRAGRRSLQLRTCRR